jgi:hypothetical protein
MSDDRPEGTWTNVTIDGVDYEVFLPAWGLPRDDKWLSMETREGQREYTPVLLFKKLLGR